MNAYTNKLTSALSRLGERRSVPSPIDCSKHSPVSSNLNGSFVPSLVEVNLETPDELDSFPVVLLDPTECGLGRSVDSRQASKKLGSLGVSGRKKRVLKGRLDGGKDLSGLRVKLGDRRLVRVDEGEELEQRRSSTSCDRRSGRSSFVEGLEEGAFNGRRAESLVEPGELLDALRHLVELVSSNVGRGSSGLLLVGLGSTKSELVVTVLDQVLLGILDGKGSKERSEVLSGGSEGLGKGVAVSGLSVSGRGIVSGLQVVVGDGSLVELDGA